MHALNQRDAGKISEVRLIAMSPQEDEAGGPEGGGDAAAATAADDKFIVAEVTDADLQSQLTAALQPASDRIVKLTVGGSGSDDDANVAESLQRQFTGVDAVVVCVGNRQPKMPRWVSPATRQITDAMAAAGGVRRLVQLSSMGIGDDRVSVGFVKVLWWAMLRTMLRSARADLEQAEGIVRTASDEWGCDYLLVRPMGLTPSKEPCGKWALVEEQSAEKAKLGIEISKTDVAAFMLDQALQPTLSRTAVTIGGQLE